MLKQLSIIVLLISLPLGLADTYGATVYKWKDTNGKLHFSDKPPAKQKSETLNIKTPASMVPVKRNKNDTGRSTTRAADYRRDVVMYSTSWCSVCKKAKKYLRKNRISFVEKDIEKSQSYHREFKKLGGTGVPLIVIGDNHKQGFRKSWINRMLGL